MTKHKLVSGIDIGSSKICAIVAQQRDEDSTQLHIIGASSVPSRGVKKGQIVNIEEATAAILEAVEGAERMAGYNISKAWVLVGGSHITAQNSHGVVAVSQPKGEISADDVSRVLEAARAVSLPSASEIVHVIPKNFTVDSQDGVKDPVGMTGIRLEVDTHIIIGSAPVTKNLVKCISEVGCDVQGMVYSGLAAGIGVLSETEKELGVVLVDIGGGTMSIAIYIEGALSYSSVLPVGAINVTKDLAAGLRISLESAEKIKLYLSNSKSKDKEDEIDLAPLQLPEEMKNVSYKTIVDGIIRPRLSEMCQLIAGEIKKSQTLGLTPSGIVLTGGGALTAGIVDTAKRVLAVPVRIGYPTGMTGLIDDIESPAYASTIGLLKYAVSSNNETGSKQSQFSQLENLPVRGIIGKAKDLLKTLLP